MTSKAIVLLSMTLASASASAAAQKWTLRNPTGRTYQAEPLRLGITLSPAGADGIVVKANGKVVRHQVERVGDVRYVWVLASLGKDETIEYTVEPGKPPRFEPEVKLAKTKAGYVLDNGRLAVRLPAAAEGGVPCPIQAVRPAGGKWVGRGFWKASRKLKGFSAEAIGDGSVFAKVRLRYDFEGKAGLWQNVPAFAQVEVSLFAGQSHAVVEESHEMSRGDYWEFDCASGWGARQAICAPHSGGFGRPDLGPWPPEALEAGQTRMGDKLLNLMPRWTQAYDEGWLFACHDGSRAVGALVCRASKWHWPHNNMIEARVKKSADYAGLRCPTWKGRRYWLLLGGPAGNWQGKAKKEYVTRHAFQPLDKLYHDYILDWPNLAEQLAKGGGKRKPKLGGFRGKDFFSSGMNPTGAMRGFGKGAIRSAGKGGNLDTLTQAQVLLDRDCYGSYWDFWSPENPNFFTDFMRGPIAMVTRLRGHPRFRQLAKLAERKLREDMYHSITLPGGAGQECPGYVAYAMHSWKMLAPLCKEYLGFDPTKWPRYKAGASFLVHASQPISPGQRRCHPGGDTHPLGPDVFAIADEFGVKVDVKKLKTEELPGFGVIFRNRPGTARETYLAFKAGPNRGHFHGDQLSIHYCADARQVAIDHMCSYGPRAGQEHMHNRVAFHTAALPWANMDGYERLIAFKTHRDADAAIAQVESERLRVTEKYPPEKWDWYLPQEALATPLKYRRTIVCVKNAAQDYFVIRDQHVGPKVKATYCLHVLSDKCERDGDTVRFGNLTLFCAAPKRFDYARHDWDFEKKRKRGGGTIIREHTKGVRLTAEGEASEFVTVLYPHSKPPKMTGVEDGVRVGADEITFAGGVDDRDAATYVTVRRGGQTVLSLTGADIDMDRLQGEVGLFVPDAGYPFGVIPDWLIKQRSKVPSWAPDWARKARKYELK